MRLFLLDRLLSSRFAFRLLKVVELQLVITALSLPLVLAWGLPVSLLAIAGNTFFTPFLFCFLLLASLVFISQLLFIPNGPLIYALERFQKFWLTCMSYVDRRTLIELPAPPVYAALIFFAVIVTLICYRVKKTITRCLLLFFILSASCLGLHFFIRPSNAHITLCHGTGTLNFFSIKNKLICVDDGIGSVSGLKSFILYTVLPTVRKKCGSTKISTLVFLKPTCASLSVARLLLDTLDTQAHTCSIVLPTCITDTDQQKHQPKVADACKALEEWSRLNCKNVIPLTENSHPLELESLEIRADGTMQRTKYFSHTLLGVHGTCGQEKITIKPVLVKCSTAASINASKT